MYTCTSHMYTYAFKHIHIATNTLTYTLMHTQIHTYTSTVHTYMHPHIQLPTQTHLLLEQKINLNLIEKYVKIKIFVELQCHQKRIY